MLLKEFSTIFDRPEKVKKLREYILSLAVRGKLVKQDENDEPASVLLDRIREEKNKLVKEKKIKKEKALPEISEDEIPYELPKGWEFVRMRELSKNIHYGYTASAKFDDTGVKFVRITDIQNNRVNWETVPYCDIDDKKLESCKLENDDILIARTGGTIGKSFIVENVDHSAVFASYLIRVIPLKSAYPRYLKLFLETPLYWIQLTSKSQGTGQPNVNAVSLSELIMPLPPLDEQKRIVEKVDYLMEFCDKLEEQLEKQVKYGSLSAKSVLNGVSDCSSYEELEEALRFIIDNFKDLTLADGAIGELKNAILSLAVKGKLVPQDESDEPASVLIERIKEEKDRLVKEKKIKKEKLLPQISEYEIPYELPNSWEWVRLGDISQLLGGNAFKSNSYVEQSNNQVIRLGNVKNDNLILNTKDVYIDDELANESIVYKIIEDDILLTMTGTREKRDYFYTCLVKKHHLSDKNLFLNQRVGVIRTFYKDLSKYLNVGLKSKDVLDIIFETETGTANQGNIGAKSVNNLIVPLPPLNEQKRIVEKVDKLMKVCDELELRIEESKKYNAKLMESILKDSLKA